MILDDSELWEIVKLTLNSKPIFRLISNTRSTTYSESADKYLHTWRVNFAIVNSCGGIDNLS